MFNTYISDNADKYTEYQKTKVVEALKEYYKREYLLRVELSNKVIYYMTFDNSSAFLHRLAWKDALEDKIFNNVIVNGL